MIEREFAEIGGEPGLVHKVVAAPVEQHLQHCLLVVARESRQQIDDLPATNRREPTHYAEIDQRDAVAGQIHHVARVRIGVEEAVHQDHLEHGIRAARSERLSVEARIVDCCQVVAADALDVLLHIHHAAGPLPVDAWDEDIEIVGKVAREAFRVACLHREIKLALERAAQLAYDLDWPVATHFGYLALDEMGKALEDSEISVDLCLFPYTTLFRSVRPAARERR